MFVGVDYSCFKISSFLNICMKKNQSRNISFLCFLFLLFCLVFLYIAHFNSPVSSDINAHASMAVSRMQEGNMLSGNFLLYFIVNVLSGFSTNVVLVTVILCLLLSWAIVTKYWVTKYILNLQKWGGAVSLSLLFVYILPLVMFFELKMGYSPLTFWRFYFVPNCWHNSTIIFSMPFALLTYFFSIKNIQNFSRNNCLKATSFCVICTMIKPSFLFAFAFPYTVLVVYKYIHNKKQLLMVLLPIGFGLFCIGYQFLTIYDGSDDSSVKFSISRLFSEEVWRYRWSFYASSLILPLVFFVSKFKKCKGDFEFFLVYFMLLISILIFFMFKETGPRELHRNFAWQIIPSMWLVYFYIVRSEISVVLKGHIFENTGFSYEKIKTIPLKDKTIILLYLTMVVMGIVYLVRYLNFGLYY